MPLKKVDGKSNEIPAVQELVWEMDIQGCLVVADALNGQKETAAAVVNGHSDYLLAVKENQPSLKQDIEEYIQDSKLRAAMETACQKEKNSGRVQMRTAFVISDIEWVEGRKCWKNMVCIGTIRSEIKTSDSQGTEGIRLC